MNEKLFEYFASPNQYRQLFDIEAMGKVTANLFNRLVRNKKILYKSE